MKLGEGDNFLVDSEVHEKQHTNAHATHLHPITL